MLDACVCSSVCIMVDTQRGHLLIWFKVEINSTWHHFNIKKNTVQVEITFLFSCRPCCAPQGQQRELHGHSSCWDRGSTAPLQQEIQAGTERCTERVEGQSDGHEDTTWRCGMDSAAPMRRQKTSAVDIYSITLHFYWSFARYFKDSHTNSCFFDWLPQNFDHIDVWTLHSLQLWTTECHFISLLQKECFCLSIKIRAWVNQGSDTPLDPAWNQKSWSLST